MDIYANVDGKRWLTLHGVSGTRSVMPGQWSGKLESPAYPGLSGWGHSKSWRQETCGLMARSFLDILLESYQRI